MTAALEALTEALLDYTPPLPGPSWTPTTMRTFPLIPGEASEVAEAILAHPAMDRLLAEAEAGRAVLALESEAGRLGGGWNIGRDSDGYNADLDRGSWVGSRPTLSEAVRDCIEHTRQHPEGRHPRAAALQGEATE